MNGDVQPVPVPMAAPVFGGRRRLSQASRLLGGFVEILLAALVIPIAILLIGLPVAIVVRGVIELMNRL